MKNVRGLLLVLAVAIATPSVVLADNSDFALKVGNRSISKEGFLSSLRVSQMENYGYYYDLYKGDTERLKNFWGEKFAGIEPESEEVIIDTNVSKGDTYADYFKNDSVKVIVNLLAEANLADEYGVEFSSDDEKKVNDAVDRFISKNDPNSLEKAGITKEGLKEYLELYTIASRVENSLINEVTVDSEGKDFTQTSIYVLGVSRNDFIEDDGESVEESATEGVETESETEQGQEINYDELAEHTAYSIITALSKAKNLDYKSMYDIVMGYDESVYPYEAYYGGGYNIFDLPKEIVEAAETLTDGWEVYKEPIRVEDEPDMYYIVVLKDKEDEVASSNIKGYIVEEEGIAHYEESLNEKLKELKNSSEINKKFISDIRISDRVIFRANYPDETESLSENKEELLKESETYKVTEMTEVD